MSSIVIFVIFFLCLATVVQSVFNPEITLFPSFFVYPCLEINLRTFYILGDLKFVVLMHLYLQAKPCKNLWVGGISPSVSKEELEEEFCKFGKMEDFKFLRDRNTAFVEYFKLEDASQAMRNMNGKRLGGDQIRVDYLRSQPSRRVSLLFITSMVFPWVYYCGSRTL